MVNQLKNFLKKIFSEFTYNEKLENYILSKNPQNICDIEYWTTEFNRRNLT